jgi:hypothetical protein
MKNPALQQDNLCSWITAHPTYINVKELSLLLIHIAMVMAMKMAQWRKLTVSEIEGTCALVWHDAFSFPHQRINISFIV